MSFHLTPISSNKKTGPIATSTSEASTCPPSCGLFQACYAKTGPQALHWRKVSEGSRGHDFDAFVSSVKALPRFSMFRHNVSGDLPGTGEDVDFEALAKLDEAVRSRRLMAWTYTHKTRHAAALAARQEVASLVVNLSADNSAQADTLSGQGLPVTCLVPIEHETNKVKSSRTPAGRLIVTCPATIRDDVSCSNCGNGAPLCARNNREYIIGFPAHGTSKKKANIIAMQEA